MLTTETISVSTIDDNQTECIIQLEEGKDLYQLNLFINKNEIEFGKDFNVRITKDNQFNMTYISDFFKELLKNPTEMKEYQIVYHNKQYTLLVESILALIFNEFKKKIEKIGIIDETLVELPTENALCSLRVQQACLNIGLPNIYLTSNKMYEQQECFVNEIIKNKEHYEKCKYRLQRGCTLLNKQNYLSSFNINENYDYKMMKNIKMKFSTQEKEKMKLCHLDNYCIMIASKYFNCIDDFVNLEMGCKHFKGNMSKFHYNPIQLTPKTRDFFPYLQTLKRYSSIDEQFENDERILFREYAKYHNFNVLAEEKNQLEVWTSKQMNNILFDSLSDNWKYETSILSERLLSKKNLLFLIEVQEEQYDENYLVGGYLNQTIEKVYNGIQYDNQKKIYFDDSKINDSKAFLFTFKDHLPKKFKINECENAFTLYPSSHKKLFSFGLFDLCVQRNELGLECVSCIDAERCNFDYDGCRNNMFEINNDEENDFCCVDVKRLLVIEMN